MSAEERAEAYINRGKEFKRKNEFSKAVQCFGEVLKLVEKVKGTKQETTAYLELGDCYKLSHTKDKSNIKKAIEFLEKALECARQRLDKEQEIDALIALGYAYPLIREQEEANRYSHQAFHLAREIGDESRLSMVVGALEKLSPWMKYKHVRLRTSGSEKERKNLEDILTIPESEPIAGSEKERKNSEDILPTPESEPIAGSEKERKNSEDILPIPESEPIADYTNDLETSCPVDDASTQVTLEKTADENLTRAETEETVDNAERVDIAYENEIDETRILIEGLLYLGPSDYNNDKIGEAIESYKQAVKIAEEAGHHDLQAKAYQHLGNVYSANSQYMEAIEYYQKAREIYSENKSDKWELTAYMTIGDNYLEACQYKECIEYYYEAVKLASQLRDGRSKVNAYFKLGNAFRFIAEYESSRKYYLKALMVAEQMADKALQRDVYKSLGGVYYQSCKFDAALKSYLKASEISHYLGDRKEVANVCLELGYTFQQLGKDEEAIEFYEKAIKDGKALEDKDKRNEAVQRLGTLYLNSASDFIKRCDNEKAIEWYKKALDLFQTECSDHPELLQEKALTGLGVAWFNLGDTEKAIESIQKAETFVQKELNDTEQKVSAEDFLTYQESQPVTVEFFNSLVVEACKPDRTERLSNEDFVRIEKYIHEFSASYVYTHSISSKEPLTENVRKSMTTNVKSTAYKNVLGLKKNKANGRNNVKFVNEDEEVFNFAREDVYKNASTAMPAILNKYFSKYMDSVGLIACGIIRGTCFLVTDEIVITNHHICQLINSEREKKENPNLPITVSFNFHGTLGTEHVAPVVTVDVDEEWDLQIENSNLDYKFLRLKNKQDRRDHPPLGPIVRCRQLQEGCVVIMGHSKGKEMRQETCVVVKTRSWREKLEQRNELAAGVHMTNAQKLEPGEKFKGSLPYDTSLFSGASGSPVFDMSGNIVAMHTQGYTLDVEGGHLSLMEFGVQFSAICEHMKSKHGTNLLEEFFPKYELGDEVFKQEPVDDGYSQEPSERRYNQESMDYINSNQTTDEINDDQLEPMDEN